MAASTINFVQGDGQPVITATLTDQTGAAVDLTGQSPKLTVRNRLGQAAIMNAVTMTPATPQTGATKGVCTYTVNPVVDVVTPGFYLCQVKVNFGGGQMTFPNDGTHLPLVIEERL